MMLICRVHSTNDFCGPDFAALELTPAVLDGLRAGQELAVQVATGPLMEHFDSVLFCEPRIVWFTWFEALDSVLSFVERRGWKTVEDAVIPDRTHPCGPRNRTELGRVQVWPKKFRFTCTLEDSETAIASGIVYFEYLPGLAESGEEEHTHDAETGRDRPGDLRAR